VPSLVSQGHPTKCPPSATLRSGTSWGPRHAGRSARRSLRYPITALRSGLAPNRVRDLRPSPRTAHQPQHHRTMTRPPRAHRSTRRGSPGRVRGTRRRGDGDPDAPRQDDRAWCQPHDDRDDGDGDPTPVIPADAGIPCVSVWTGPRSPAGGPGLRRDDTGVGLTVRVALPRSSPRTRGSRERPCGLVPGHPPGVPACSSRRSSTPSLGSGVRASSYPTRPASACAGMTWGSG